MARLGLIRDLKTRDGKVSKMGIDDIGMLDLDQLLRS